MKVLWLIKGLGIGGAEKLLVLAAPHVDRTRFQYEVAFVLPWKTALVGDLESRGIPSQCLNHARAFDPRVIRRLMMVVRERKVELIHAHLPYAGIIGRLAARLAGVPCVYTEHNLQERYHPLTRILNQLTLSMCDRVIAVSEEVRQSLLRSPLARNTPVVTIPNGIDIDPIQQAARNPSIRDELAIPPDHRIIGVVSIFRRPKRLDLWIQAARHVADAEPRSTFVVVGDGPSRPRLMALADAMGLSGRIRFTGMRPDPARFMTAFDVFMLSSDYEGLPVAVLEAMAVRTPIVATRVGGLLDVIEDGAQGFLVAPGNPVALAEKVVAVLRNPTLRQEMGEASLRRVREQFSIERMVQDMERLYSDLLEVNARPSQPVATVAEP